MPITLPNYPNYFGGKSGPGTYQTLINHTPPHKTLITGCAGNCGLTRHIRPAALTIINDLDKQLTYAWLEAVDYSKKYRFFNVDVAELIRSTIAKDFDTADTFLYLDPPYRFVTRRGQKPVYKFEMTEAQHVALLNAALALKHCRVMISHYPNDLYDEVLQGWRTHDFWVQTRKDPALERIYMNYELTGKLHDYSYIGEDFRVREKLSRIKKNLIAKLDRLDPVLRNSILADLASHFEAI